LSEPSTKPDPTLAVQQAVADLFTVEAVMLDPNQAGVIHLYGRFLVDSAEAYRLAYQRFRALGYTPLFRSSEGRQIIVAAPGQLPGLKPKWTVPAVLFAVTVLTTLFAGMDWQPGRPLWQNLLSGATFSMGLLSILLAHEMAHFLVGRHLGVPVSLPYFIPLPIPPLGTMGAFIQMKAPPQNRRHLLAVGMAGPLAGLVVALPLLLVGLRMSPLELLGETDPQRQVIMEGNSILYGLAKVAVFHRFVPDCYPAIPEGVLDVVQTALFGCRPGIGDDVMLKPLAFAGWAGLLVTGLNLIPAGQLDGGHVAYALLGKRARYLNWAVIVFLVLLGLFTSWWGWFIWAGLIFLLGRHPAAPLDDVTRLEGWQVALAILMMVIFVLTFVPIPMRLI